MTTKNSQHTTTSQSTIQHSMRSDTQKKIIVIPKENSNLHQTNKQLREEFKKQDANPKIHFIRKTRNNNLEIKTSEKEIEKITKIIRTSSTLQKLVHLIETDKRKRKILLLRVPADIIQNDLETELTHKGHFTNNDFKFVKFFETNKGYHRK